MAELYCRKACSEHEIEIEEKDIEILDNLFGHIEHQFKSAEYDEETKDIIIRLEDKNIL